MHASMNEAKTNNDSSVRARFKFILIHDMNDKSYTIAAAPSISQRLGHSKDRMRADAADSTLVPAQLPQYRWRRGTL